MPEEISGKNDGKKKDLLKSVKEKVEKKYSDFVETLPRAQLYKEIKGLRSDAFKKQQEIAPGIKEPMNKNLDWNQARDEYYSTGYEDMDKKRAAGQKMDYARSAEYKKSQMMERNLNAHRMMKKRDSGKLASRAASKIEPLKKIADQFHDFKAFKGMALKDAAQEFRGGQEARLNAQKFQDKKAKIGIAGKAKKGFNKLKMATDNLLKSMIRVTIPSWSLSMFYVYIHVFLSGVFSSMFSPLGHEWVPNTIKQSDPELAKRTGDRIGLAEKPLVGCCCFIHLVIIIIIIAIIYFILHAWEVAWEFLKDWLSSIGISWEG